MKYSRWLCLLPILFFAVKPAFSQCGGPNIALNKKVAVSHFIHLAEGARAVDGSIANGSRWKTPDTARVNGELIEWINVDLDSTRNVCTVRMIWETLAFPSSYKIETSDDAKVWKEVLSITNNRRYDTSVTIAGRGRYLRVYHVKPYYDWNNSYSMLELQVFEGTGAANIPPVVELTSPSSDGSGGRLGFIYFGASASDDGRVTKVEFYVGNTKVGEDTTAPYSVKWVDAVIGTWVVYCKAYDNGTPVLVTTSQSRSFKVELGINGPPSADITSPLNNSTFTAGSTITLNATAIDYDYNDYVTRVEFYEGTTKLGADSTAESGGKYSFEWKNVPAGTYSVKVQAYDNGNPVNSLITMPITITVTPTTLAETDPIFSAERANLVRINGAYYNPSWIQSLHASKIIAPGASTQVIFNNGGFLGANQHFTYNPATSNFTFGGPAGDYFTDFASFASSFGHANYLRNQGSNAFGFNNDVQARSSTVFGEHHKVYSTAQSSNAFGELHTVRGVGSAVFGMSNFTSAYGSFVVGHYSPDITGATNSIIPTDPLFVVANGTSATNRSAALVVYKNGITRFSGRTKHVGGIEFADGSVQTTAVVLDTIVWSLNGNRNLPDGSFIGTTDKKPLIFSTGGKERLRIDSTGMVVIGASTPGTSDFNLYVEKGIRTGKVRVAPNSWADYVFESKYSLRSLSEVEAYIKRFKRLPEMPSADEVKNNGVDLGDTQVLLLKKIEELTLYVIDLNKKVEALSKENEKLNKLVKEKK